MHTHHVCISGTRARRQWLLGGCGAQAAQSGYEHLPHNDTDTSIMRSGGPKCWPLNIDQNETERHVLTVNRDAELFLGQT